MLHTAAVLCCHGVPGMEEHGQQHLQHLSKQVHALAQLLKVALLNLHSRAGQDSMRQAFEHNTQLD